MSLRIPYLQHGRRHGPNGSDPIVGLQRMSWGRLFNDGSVLDAGSGDWTAELDSPNNFMVITFDPGFSSPPSFAVVPNDNGDPQSSVPPLNSGASSNSGFFRADLVESVAPYATINVFSWDLDGNILTGDIGFDFMAVAAS